MKMARGRQGFTLIEILVVVIIIGVMALIAIPSYLKSVEISRADDAQAMMAQIATTNRMFALDHGGQYVTGQAPLSGSCLGAGIINCPASPPYNNFCHLVACKYLADQDWGSKPYAAAAAGNANPTAGTTCVLPTVGGTYVVACVKRKSGTYSNWCYITRRDGFVEAGLGSPPVNN